MNIKIKTTGLSAGLRLDLKKNGSVWDLYQGETSLEQGIAFNDSALGLDHYKVIVNDDTQSVRVVRFADLHRHSDNSLKDGIIKVSDMAKRTEYAGALTDHGNMYGFLEHYTAMKDAGKHPIIGIEAYQENAIGKLERNHLILLAKNETGYRNLLKLTSESFDHFYRAPHVTWEMLEKHHEGVICSSACLGGVIPQALLNRDRELAKSLVKRFQSIFGEDFYLEIQRHNIADEMVVNPGLISLSKEMNVPLIATTDSHYLNKEDAFAHEVTLCLQTGKKMDESHMKFEGTGYHLFTSAEMEELFSDIPEVLDNTLRLAEKCSVDLKLGDVNLPNYQLPDGFETDFDYFKHLCEEGFKNRFRGKPELNDPKYKERFDYEMGVIKKMGFASYFIIVQDFINYARKINVYIGPGRGSAAGSLLAFCMGITDMDPIRFNLLFERFLNPERVSWPDIDTDIEHVGRQKVIDYITKKYGAESVCRIVTFGTMAAKMVIKDVSRVMGYPPGWANALSKMVPDGPKMTLEKAVDMNPELRNRLASDKDASRVFDIAKTLEGTKRHASQHACFEKGTLVITDKGSVPIEQVKEGDKVLTHTGRYQTVAKTMTTLTEEVYDIEAEGLPKVTVTGNHPILTCFADSLFWTPVQELDPSENEIVCYSKGAFVKKLFTVDVRKVPVQTMYNLTVENDSSYTANGIVAHNCGLVISPGSVSNFLPTSMETNTETKEKSVTSQVVMTEVEALSLLKMDLLGLKNLTAIHEVITNIKKTRGIHIKYQDIPLNDRATYQMLAKGITGGVFQLESPGMTKVVMQMLSDVDTMPDDRVEECFERLIAAVALYRPGPMDYIPDYVAGMQNPSHIQYDCPEEEKYLSSTFGVMVYQEQLMQVAQGLAGYSLGEADLLRKACGKKKKDVMAKEQSRFIYGNKADFKQGKAKHLIPGCVGNGISEDTAMHVWEKMEKFASYAFNRSHAACYAWIAYITAYMSCHWAPEFHCAMMNAFEDIGDKVKGYLALAARRNIQILPPDINKSLDKNTVEGEGIRIGFHSLSHLNKFSRGIIRERKANGLFTDYQNFFERMSDVGDRPSKNVIESLIFSGALDCFGLNKAQLMQFTAILNNDYKANAVNRAMGQMTLFDADNFKLTPPVVEEYNKHTLMDEEYKAVGFYLTDHPVDEFNRLMSGEPNYLSISDLALSNMSRSVSTCGMIRDLRQLFTRKDEEMYVFTLEDRFNSVRCVMFPSRVEANRHVLEHGAIVKAVGNYVIDEERGNQIIVEDLFSPTETKQMKMDSVTVSIRNREEQERLLAFVRQNRGKVEVRIQAKGKIYHTSCGINLTPSVLDFLTRNFQAVKT